MRRHPVREDIRKAWKTFPLRIEGFRPSRCCGARTVLVQSMEGGFVTSNCWKCGNYETMGNSEFLNQLRLWVQCPSCKEPMVRGMVEKNYAFVCAKCDIYIHLADLLPRWDDVH